MDKAWLKHYPLGVPAEIDVGRFASLAALLDDSFGRHARRTALRFMGRSFSYEQLDEMSRALAAWLQAQGVQRGDRVALMMPNTPQYAVAVAAILRAGAVVVNVSPHHGAAELEHRLKDSGAHLIFVVEAVACTLQAVVETVPVRRIVVTGLGDLLGFPKAQIVNAVMRSVRKAVPPYELPGSIGFGEALARGRRLGFRQATPAPDDIAMLQYTGGTTGPSKAAVLLHRNLVANVLQAEAWYRPALARVPGGEPIVSVWALPLHHIFGFGTNLMLGLHTGGCGLVIPDAWDLPALFKALSTETFHSFPASNTLFDAMVHHPDFATVDWSNLVISVGGGMAVTAATARRWLEKTGCPIVEGYGLSETSPSVTCNPVDSRSYSGTVGLPLPSTDVRLLDDDGREVPPGMPGEIAVRGPQVMAGYWQRPEETARVMTPDGFLRTGDIGTVDEQGHIRVVDRKKDVILVGGFNVYPAEVEDVVGQMPGVLECAAVGMPDLQHGEQVKLVVVRSDPALSEDHVRRYCDQHLTGYKRPRTVEFRAELPKTVVGKVLRRELRG